MGPHYSPPMSSIRRQGKLQLFSTDYRIRISLFLHFSKEAVDQYCGRSLQRGYVGHANNLGEQNGGFVTADVCKDACISSGVCGLKFVMLVAAVKGMIISPMYFFRLMVCDYVRYLSTSQNKASFLGDSCCSFEVCKGTHPERQVARSIKLYTVEPDIFRVSGNNVVVCEPSGAQYIEVAFRFLDILCNHTGCYFRFNKAHKYAC